MLQEIILVAMEGPKFTLYEDVLLLFTVRIPDSYPDQPPVFCYQSYSQGEVNPCLQVDGTVLCPLLDTYPVMYGSRQENWDREDPSLAVILLCINSESKYFERLCSLYASAIKQRVRLLMCVAHPLGSPRHNAVGLRRKNYVF